MTNESEPELNAVPSPPRRLRRPLSRLALVLLGILAVYLLVAYLVAPAYWLRFARRHPALVGLPGVTSARDGHPGDPINVALVGTERDLKEAFQAAGWFAADPLSLRSDLKIAADTVLERPYDEAPVSNLYLWGRP
jgi:hypothetical protein